MFTGNYPNGAYTPGNINNIGGNILAKNKNILMVVIGVAGLVGLMGLIVLVVLVVLMRAALAPTRSTMSAEFPPTDLQAGLPAVSTETASFPSSGLRAVSTATVAGVLSESTETTEDSSASEASSDSKQVVAVFKGRSNFEFRSAEASNTTREGTEQRMKRHYTGAIWTFYSDGTFALKAYDSLPISGRYNSQGSTITFDGGYNWSSSNGSIAIKVTGTITLSSNGSAVMNINDEGRSIMAAVVYNTSYGANVWDMATFSQSCTKVR